MLFIAIVFFVHVIIFSKKPPNSNKHDLICGGVAYMKTYLHTGAWLRLRVALPARPISVKVCARGCARRRPFTASCAN